MSNKESGRGRGQDRKKVAGGQDYEVGYEAQKEGTTAKKVKDTIKKVGNNRKKVEDELKKNSE